MMADKLKWHRRKNREAMCRGSLAWLGRQTHNLECKRGHRPMPRSRGLESRPRHQQFMIFQVGNSQYQQNTICGRLAWSRLVDLGSIDSGSNPGSPTINFSSHLKSAISLFRKSPCLTMSSYAINFYV